MNSRDETNKTRTKFSKDPRSKDNFLTKDYDSLDHSFSE